MVTLMTRETEKKVTARDEFEKYLAKQRLSTTFNGTLVEEFSIYKKFLGLSN